MNFKTTKNKVGITIESSIPCDTYGQYLAKFLDEARSIISNDELIKIITPLLDLKSWRLLNREMRRACDQYCTDHNIMNHADYQAKFFYEGTMINRTMYGKNAPWVTDVQVKPQSPKNSAQATPAVKEKARKIITEALIPEGIEKGVKVASPGTRATAYGLTKEEIAEFGPYDMRDPWCRINFEIAKSIKMLD